jgi:hypothetical protein
VRSGSSNNPDTFRYTHFPLLILRTILLRIAWDLRLQNRRYASRCQRRSVSGWTIKSACFQARTALAKSTRRIRSVFVHVGRFTCRLSMMSGCRKRACSAMSSALLLARSASVPSGKEQVGGLVHCTKRVGSTLTYVPMSRLRQECIWFTNVLLLQKDTLIFRLSCELMFTSPNCILVADGSATSEGTLYYTYTALSERMC